MGVRGSLTVVEVVVKILNRMLAVWTCEHGGRVWFWMRRWNDVGVLVWLWWLCWAMMGMDVNFDEKAKSICGFFEYICLWSIIIYK